MTPTEIDAALAAANPLTGRTAAALALHDAEIELIQQLVSTPAPRRPAPPAGIPARRRRLVLALVAAAVVAAVLTVVPLGGRGGGPSPAFAASLIRFANHTPLVLLRAPGWRVVYVYQRPGGYGEMHFAHGPAGAQLVWSRATPSMRKWVAGGRERAETGLGVQARRFVFEGAAHGRFGMRAFFIYRGRELYFTAAVTSMSMFRSELRALTAVDTTTWLRAMPPSVIKSAESSRVVRQMLKGIPLPPGFDAARIRGAHLVQNRYDLGVAVTGTVACMWIADWNRARKDGDHSMVHRAIAAMATSPHWPVFHAMDRQGAWPEVLIGYAKAMRRGTWYGRPLVGDVNSGLGCSELGIHLGG
jgi:hypothetical protein